MIDWDGWIRHDDYYFLGEMDRGREVADDFCPGNVYLYRGVQSVLFISYSTNSAPTRWEPPAKRASSSI